MVDFFSAPEPGKKIRQHPAAGLRHPLPADTGGHTAQHHHMAQRVNCSIQGQRMGKAHPHIPEDPPGSGMALPGQLLHLPQLLSRGQGRICGNSGGSGQPFSSHVTGAIIVSRPV